MWCRESFSDRSCESGLASLYAVDKLSTFHSHKGRWWEWQLGIPWFWFPLRFRTFLLSRPIDDRLREGAAEVGEIFYYLQSLFLDGDVGLDIWFSRRWLVHHLSLLYWWFDQNCQRHWELSTLFCMLAFVVAFSAQSSANRNSLTISVFTLVFAWSLLRLKTKPFVR